MRRRRLSGVHIVGGAVRDLALGLVPHEIDVAVDGDPDPLLAALGGADVEHERFGTATVDGVDVVRARAESYPAAGRPARGPARASIDEDLARRDFTVNAIAVALDGGERARGRTRRRGSRRAAPAGSARRLVSRRPDAPVAPGALRGAPGLRDRGPNAAARRRGGRRRRAEHRLAACGWATSCASRCASPTRSAALVEATSLGLLPPGFAPVRPDEALELLPPGEGRPDLVILAASCAGMDARALLAWLDHMGFVAPERDLVAAASRFVIGAPLRNATHPGGDRQGCARRPARGRRAGRRRQRAALDRRAAPRRAAHHGRRPAGRRHPAGPGGRPAAAPRAGARAGRRDPARARRRAGRGAGE